MSNNNVLIYEVNMYYPSRKKPVKTLRVFPSIYEYEVALQVFQNLISLGQLNDFKVTPLTKNSEQLSDIKKIIKNYESIPTNEFALLMNVLT